MTFDADLVDVSGLGGVERLQQEVIDQEQVDPDQPQAAGHYEAWRTIAAVETGQSHAATYPSRRDDYGKDLQSLLDAVQLTSAAAAEVLREPLAVLARARSGEADGALLGVDVLAVPSRRQGPYSIAEAEQLYERSDLAELEMRADSQNLAVLDLTGQPAISVPCGFSTDEMPVGLMMVARRWDVAAGSAPARSGARSGGGAAGSE